MAETKVFVASATYVCISCGHCYAPLIPYRANDEFAVKNVEPVLTVSIVIDVIAFVLCHKPDTKNASPLPLLSVPDNVLIVLYLLVFV